GTFSKERRKAPLLRRDSSWPQLNLNQHFDAAERAPSTASKADISRAQPMSAIHRKRKGVALRGSLLSPNSFPSWPDRALPCAGLPAAAVLADQPSLLRNSRSRVRNAHDCCYANSCSQYHHET